MRQHIEDGLDAAVRTQLHLEEGHEKYNFRMFCRRITNIDIAKNGVISVEKATGMMAKTKTADEGTPVTYTESQVQSMIDKSLHKHRLLLADGKWKGKGKRKNGKGDGRDDGKRPKKEDMLIEEDLPEIAKEEMMKRYYSPSDFKKRMAHSDSGESKKKKYHLYGKDRWGFGAKQRYACFSCRKTGHTADRCPNE